MTWKIFNRNNNEIVLLVLLLYNITIQLSLSFVVTPSFPSPSSDQIIQTYHGRYHHHTKNTNSIVSLKQSQQRQQQQQVTFNSTIDDEKVKELFAWVRCLLGGSDDERYDDMILAITAIFSEGLPEDSIPRVMVREALELLPKEEDNIDEFLMGDALGRSQRETYSMGAMGAGQWSGQYQTRPHALLPLTNLTSVEDWIQTLPRGVKRTLKKARAAYGTNFTVTAKPICGGQAAPHSSIGHFRCVIEHEVRLLTPRQNNNNDYVDNSYDSYMQFINALATAVNRYIGTTRMTGEIREYRNPTTNRVLAFAHEVRKGNTIRGQWFYATDEASKNYVWFHSVYSLVERAIALKEEDITCVDLGPSGSDAFSQLKERYGFQSVTDWPAVANYLGPFYYYDDEDQNDGGDNVMEKLMRSLGIDFL